MAISQIEKIKQEYTDKYVVVDGSRPELARFGDVVGQVRTVNMSGRALVEFLDFHLNTGWHDIDLDYLKVVNKPKPQEKKPAAKKPAAKPGAKKPAAAGEKKLSPLEMARQQGAGGAKKPAAAGGKKLSPLEMARQQGAAGAKKPAASGEKKLSPLEMARQQGAAGAKSKPAEEAEAAPEPEAAPVVETPDAEGPTKIDRSSMNVEAMVAYCREHDA